MRPCGPKKRGNAGPRLKVTTEGVEALSSSSFTKGTDGISAFRTMEAEPSICPMAAIACHVNCSTNPQFYAEMTGSPRFLGKPQCIHALLSDSGGTLTQMPKCVQVLPSAPKHAVGSPDASLSGLNHTAHMLPVHASQKGLPQYCATPDSGCRHAWPEAIHYPLGCYEKFQRYVTSPPNFPGLTWRTLGPIPVTRSR